MRVYGQTMLNYTKTNLTWRQVHFVLVFAMYNSVPNLGPSVFVVVLPGNHLTSAKCINSKHENRHIFEVRVRVHDSEIIRHGPFRKSSNDFRYKNVSCSRQIISLLISVLFSKYYSFSQWIVPQRFKLLPKRHIFFYLVIRFITNRKYAFFCIF